MTMWKERVGSPLGEIWLLHDGESLGAVDFEGNEERLAGLTARFLGGAALVEATQESRFATVLRAYFAGEIEAIDSLPTMKLGTEFQRKVWAALRGIPAGETRSYGQLAAQLGNAKAMRAVGLANGQNPIGIVVPCHRVVGANGSLTGYAGGLHRKEWLLKHEARYCAARFRLRSS
jgi:methylated-DNA-[protein]-cysteine S-methyltransferase